jgi:hypothetical protein
MGPRGPHTLAHVNGPDTGRQIEITPIKKIYWRSYEAAKDHLKSRSAPGRNSNTSHGHHWRTAVSGELCGARTGPERWSDAIEHHDPPSTPTGTAVEVVITAGGQKQGKVWAANLAGLFQQRATGSKAAGAGAETSWLFIV